MKIEIKNGGFSYRKGTTVLQNMNFEAHSGELIAVLGPNGAGKTTLLRCMMGFLKWTQGESLLDGEPIHSIPLKKLWQRVAYVPQAKNTFAALSVRDMILLGCTNRMGLFSVPGRKEQEKVQEVAEQLHITALLPKQCNEISGGELQMVLIARALVAQPELLILDEPESNLDFKNQLIILETMSKLSEQGLCCIFNTHYPSHALMRASKSLLLHKGGEAWFGPTAEIVTEKNIEKAFGVKAMIGEFETSGNIYRSILPLQISQPQEKSVEDEQAREAIAVISMIFSQFSLSARINELIHAYHPYIIGRMGMPYKDGGVYIIHVTVDAPMGKIQTLSHQLSILPGIQVKATIAKKETAHDDKSNIDRSITDQPSINP